MSYLGDRCDKALRVGVRMLNVRKIWYDIKEGL